MEQEVSVRVNDLVAQGRRNCVRSTVDHRTGGRSNDSCDMTDTAADILKQSRADLRVHCLRERRVARWNLGAANELREMIDVRQADIRPWIFPSNPQPTGELSSGLWRNSWCLQVAQPGPQHFAAEADEMRV